MEQQRLMMGRVNTLISIDPILEAEKRQEKVKTGSGRSK